MLHRMLIESDPHETRVAVLEAERLVELVVERRRRRGLVGNIYKGRVTRVLAGMQAAFVDIGLERDAFLYVDDAGGSRKRLAVIEDKQSTSESKIESEEPAPTISDLVTQGEQILVQVRRDPLPQKGARVTTQIALPARYVVLLPDAGRAAVSRRVEDPDERERLLELVDPLIERHGLIVRTAGEGVEADEVVADHRYLLGVWKAAEECASKTTAPGLVHEDLDPALRVVRDWVDGSFSEIEIQGPETFRRVVSFLDEVQASFLDRVKDWTGPGTLFEYHGLENQIDAALRSRVWLKSGGYLIIHPTEALVAIDINTGRFVGKTNLEETVFATNLEAAREVVRQIRLRDLGGIIVVDFIDMDQPENRAAVFAELEAELEKDRARSKALSLSDFGLVEITRKRSRSNLERVLTVACPDCRGRGRIKSVETVCLELRRQLLGSIDQVVGREVMIQVHPVIEEALRVGSETDVLGEIEQALGRRLLIRTDPSLDRDSCEIEVL
jgi:ribonuclease G